MVSSHFLPSVEDDSAISFRSGLSKVVKRSVTIAYRTTTAKPRFRQLSPRVAHHRTPAFVRPHCVPNPKIAEIHLLRHCRDRDVMFGRRDMEHKAMEVYSTIDR